MRPNSLFTSTVLVAILAAGIALPLEAGPEPAPQANLGADTTWRLPLIGTGVKTNDAYTDGNIFLTLPVWSTIGRDGTLGGNYLFIEPYSSIGESGEVATSLGLSWRHLFSDEPVSALQKKGSTGFMDEGWFIGTSIFMDMLDTQHHNSFWQMGVGAEIGNRWLELRGNYYIPLTGQKLAQRNVSERSFSTASSRSSTSYNTTGGGYGDPFATGNQVLQSVDQTTTATTTTTTTYRTTTVRTVTEIFEKGMGGWDAELAVLVPGLDQWADVRLIAGYFSFDNQPFGPQEFGTGKVHGWKAGVEVRPVPALVFTGMWYEDKRFTGGNWLLGVQLQVPLDETWHDAFKPRRRHLVEHLAEPVHRQNDASKIGNRKDEHSTSTTSTRSSVQRVTRVVSQEQGRIVLADDIIFVNNGPAVGNGIQAGSDATGNGTAEKPVATVQTGANIAGANNTSTGRVWNVYTQGGGATSTYAESVKVKGSTNFVSSFTAIAGQGGKVFGGNTARPLVQGGFLAQNIPSVVITGYEINTGLSTNVLSAHGGIANGQGIFFENVTNGLIKNNSIHNVSANGIYAETNGTLPTTLDATGNTISNNGNHGMVAASFDNANATFNVSNNTFSGNSLYGFASSVSQASTGNFNLTGNTITGNASGVGVWTYAENNSTANFSMTGNTVKDQPGDGLFLKGVDDSNFASVVIANNTFINTGSKAVHVLVDDLPGSAPTATLDIRSNTITNPGSDGIYILAQKNGASVYITALDNNIITDAGITGVSISNGITLRAESGARITAPDISGNTITNSKWNGIELFADGPSSATFPTILTANVTGNTFHTAGNDYIHTESHNAAVLSLTANTNTLASANQDGFNIHAYDSSTTNFTATGNTITDQIGRGFRVYGDGANVGAPSTLNVTITGNVVDNSATVGGYVGGIEISGSGAGSIVNVLALDNNTVKSSGIEGIFIASNVGARVIATSISGNTLTNSASEGLRFFAASYSTLTATASGNTISGSARNAVLIDAFQSGGVTTLTLKDNTFNVADGWIGINAHAIDTAVLNLTATGNQITGGTGGHGIYLATFANSYFFFPGANFSTINATLNGNTITGGTGFSGISGQSNEGSTQNTIITSNKITVGNTGTTFANSGILMSSGWSSQINLTIGGNTISVGNTSGAFTTDGINLSVYGANPMKVNTLVAPVDNTITKGTGPGLFLRTTGNFGPGSTIKVNGTTLTPPSDL